LAPVATVQLQKGPGACETKPVDGRGPVQPLTCIQTKAASEQTPTTQAAWALGFVANSFPLQIRFFSTLSHISADKTNAAGQTSAPD